ncbi:hypothetical protein NQ314_020962 [Rhamnusium bicolor]|uniref:NADH dehydrogenase [ubiquinone] 1 alpha subcomplex subunit 13 n=1 Tax=Rhamnusium bicolor TaxID=1586634 RepID=A0AAV8WJD3_9CUCU|nr:hypothetical protein NQ314_020962 [Rhamnusium bicolor]
MATAEAQCRQDLPPPGGYKRWALFGGYLAMTAGAGYLYYLNCKAVKITDLEIRSASLAIYPMLLAERDREYLKQLRRNRDEENELMRNVEGWKTGTWYGEPIYHTQDKNLLINPRFQEYYVHASYKDYTNRAHIGLLS